MTVAILTPVCQLTDEQLLEKYKALLDEGILSGQQTVRLWAIAEELERRGYVAGAEGETELISSIQAKRPQSPCFEGVLILSNKTLDILTIVSIIRVLIE